jgi:hypothetical protein
MLNEPAASTDVSFAYKPSGDFSHDIHRKAPSRSPSKPKRVLVFNSCRMQTDHRQKHEATRVEVQQPRQRAFRNTSICHPWPGRHFLVQYDLPYQFFSPTVTL